MTEKRERKRERERERDCREREREREREIAEREILKYNLTSYSYERIFTWNALVKTVRVRVRECERTLAPMIKGREWS